MIPELTITILIPRPGMRHFELIQRWNSSVTGLLSARMWNACSAQARVEQDLVHNPQIGECHAFWMPLKVPNPGDFLKIRPDVGEKAGRIQSRNSSRKTHACSARTEFGYDPLQNPQIGECTAFWMPLKVLNPGDLLKIRTHGWEKAGRLQSTFESWKKLHKQG